MSSSTTTVLSATRRSSSPAWPHPVGATSTVAGAAIVNAIAAETAQLLGELGCACGVLASSNVGGGDQHNEALLAPFRDRVRSL